MTTTESELVRSAIASRSRRSALVRSAWSARRRTQPNTAGPMSGGSGSAFGSNAAPPLNIMNGGAASMLGTGGCTICGAGWTVPATGGCGSGRGCEPRADLDELCDSAEGRGAGIAAAAGGFNDDGRGALVTIESDFDFDFDFDRDAGFGCACTAPRASCFFLVEVPDVRAKLVARSRSKAPAGRCVGGS